jgi:methyl-accepting chemotaxis protein
MGWGRVRSRGKGKGGRLFLPLILILFLCSALSAGALLGLVRRLDGTAAEQTHSVVRGTIASELIVAADGVFENARWDDAVRHLYGPLDQRWAGANISGSGVAYIVDRRGKTLFGRRADGTVDPPLAQAAPDAYRHLLAGLPKTRAEATRLRRGLSMIGRYRGRPAFIAGMAVLPLQDPLPMPERDLRYLIHVVPINDAVLARWSASYRVSGLRFATGEEAGWPLTDPRGRELARLTWIAPHPGTQALRDVAPPLTGALLLLVALSWWLLSGLRRQADALVQTSEGRRVAAEQAEAARQLAEQARVEAEGAATREAEARRRHEQELRAASHSIGQSLRAALARLSADLLESAETLDRSADRTASTIRAQQEQLQQVRARAEATTGAIEAIEEEVRTFTAAVREIGSAARLAESHVGSAASRSTEGATISDHLVQHLDEIERTTSSIAQIASQTNMLALNATIEAARGGNNAAGFAVVAAEVKALAGRVTGLTSEVTGKLRRIASAGRDTADVSNAVQHALGAVQQSITTTAAAAARQDQASASINMNIGRVSDEAEQMEEVISAVAASADDLVATARSTRVISGQVRTHAQALLAQLDESIAKLLAA